MSNFDPFRPATPAGCVCGMHRSQAEHEQQVRMLQLATVQNEERERGHDGVVATAVLHRMFPRGT